MKKGSFAALAVAVLIAAGWLVTRFLAPPAPRIDDPSAAGSRAPVPERAEPELASGGHADPEPSRSEVEPLALPASGPAAEPPMPASYRAALAGVRGRLVEPDGEPAAGLRVELLEIAPAEMFGDFERAFLAAPPGVPDLSLASATSGADGVFELRGALPAAFHGIGIDLGGPRGTLRLIDQTLRTAEVTDLGDVVLGAFVTWRGRIEDEDGEPVAGARVRATLLPPLVFQPGVADVARAAALMEVRSRPDGAAPVFAVPPSVRAWDAKLPFPTATSGEDGRFELAGVPQGTATLVVDREGFSGTFKGPTPTGRRDQDVGTIVLSRGIAIPGRVVDAGGEPVAGAQVVAGFVIAPASLAIAFAAAAPTDADGSFIVEHLTEQMGEFRVAARREGAGGWSVVTTDGSGPVTVTIGAGLPLDVRLVALDGAVVPDAELALRRADGPPFLTWDQPARLDPSRVTRIADGHLRIESLERGRWQLFGSAPGFARASVVISLGLEENEWFEPGVVQIPSDGSSGATLTFTAAVELPVRVVDAATREPIEHARVTATVGETPTPTLILPLAARRTDAAGETRIGGLPLAPMRIRAEHPAHAPESRLLDAAEMASADARVELALGPGAAIAGRIHQGGRQVAEPMLFLLNPNPRPDAIEDSMPRFAVPDAEGRFRLAGLPSGEARWEVIPRLFDGNPEELIGDMFRLARMDASPRRGTVELVAGETVELDVDLDPAVANRPGCVRGIVRTSGPDVAVRVHLMRWDQDSGEQSTEVVDARTNETFVIDGVAPGWINLMIERPPADGSGGKHPSNPFHQVGFELQPGGVQQIDVSIEPTAAEVLVLDDAGAAVAHAQVGFRWREETAESDGIVREQVQSMWAMTDAEGLARIELPRAGEYSVHTQHAGSGQATVTASFPSRGPVELALDRGVPCAGRFELAPDPGPDATIYVTVYQRTEETGMDSIAQVRLGGGEREFDLVGVAPGSYHVNVWADDGHHGQGTLELGHNGDDRLVVRIPMQR